MPFLASSISAHVDCRQNELGPSFLGASGEQDEVASRTIAGAPQDGPGRRENLRLPSRGGHAIRPGGRMPRASPVPTDYERVGTAGRDGSLDPGEWPQLRRPMWGDLEQSGAQRRLDPSRLRSLHSRIPPMFQRCSAFRGGIASEGVANPADHTSGCRVRRPTKRTTSTR